jgi:hypothetical protein
VPWHHHDLPWSQLSCIVADLHDFGDGLVPQCEWPAKWGKASDDCAIEITRCRGDGSHYRVRIEFQLRVRNLDVT